MAVLEGTVVIAAYPDLAIMVARAQGGDQAAFDAIYDRFADPLFRYLYARCGDVGLAEELTGDLWVRVVERLPTFRFPRGSPEAAFAAWLYQIARNLVLDGSRRHSSGNHPLVPAAAAHDVPPNERVITGEAKQEVWAAIEKLTAEQREVLLLRFVEDRTNTEVRLLTGQPEEAVKVIQHRALGALVHTLGARC